MKKEKRFSLDDAKMNHLLFTSDRKKMWADAKRMLNKVDSSLGLKEIYAIGSFVSEKTRPADIDFCIVTKVKKNSSYPIDLVIVPEGDETSKYIRDIDKWLKNRYKKKTEVIKLK